MSLFRLLLSLRKCERSISKEGGSVGGIEDITGGPLTAPYVEGRAQYNIRALDEYVRRVGKDPSELTEVELERFLVRKRLVGSHDVSA